MIPLPGWPAAAGGTGFHIGSGTGKSTFAIARHANWVVGVEPWMEMRSVALAKQDQLGIANGEFLDGSGEDLPSFRDSEFDHAVSVWSVPILWPDRIRWQHDSDALIDRCLRVVKPGGSIAIVAATPGWMHDHLRPDRGDVSLSPSGINDLLDPRGFDHRDVVVTTDYGSLSEAVATYGFIYGPQAIEHPTECQTSRVTWSLRIHYRHVE